MSLAEYAERIQELGNAYEILVGKTGEKRALEDLDAGAEGGEAYCYASKLITQK
jgi:hypothetical protein